MSSKRFSIFSAIIILLYAGAFVYFLGGLITTANQGAQTSQDYFDQFAASVEQLHEQETILSSGYIAALKKLTDDTPYVQAILLKKDSVPFLAYPTDSGLIKQDANHTPVLSNSSPVIKLYSKTVSLGAGGTVAITAAASTITKESVFKLALKSFCIILVTTLAVIIHLIISSSRKNTETMEKITGSEENTVSELQEAKESKHSDESNLKTITSDEAEDNQETGTSDEFQYIDNVTASDLPSDSEEKISSEFAEAMENTAIDSESAQNNIMDPSGLFSPVTGFCWESYLETRLDTELTRAASCETDLALFHIRLYGTDTSQSGMQPVFDQIIQFFQYRDLIFESGNDGCYCVVPDISIDGAMSASEKLYGLLYQALSRSGISAKIVIGISTRSMRLTPASRLITEASEAVAHALEEDDMPIVAFRVNQEKYREYLEEEAKKLTDED